MLEFPGTLRYRVIRRIGEGDTGVVYEAFDRERQKHVALKTLRSVSPTHLCRFKREFRTLADISHGNLVTLHELGKFDRQWFFTMELVDGVPFLVWCRGSTRRLRAALHGLAEGLIALHDAGKLHRDIKSSNVLVTHKGRVVLLDFGVTAASVAPELSAGRPPNAAADWYAVGTTLYQALTGRLPFAAAVAQGVHDGPLRRPTPPDDLVENLPDDLVELCMDLLAVRPQDRPDGREVLRHLGATPPALPPPIRPWQKPEFVPPFVGRRDALDTLNRVFSSVERGAAAVVHLTGAPGIGKSALLQHFLDQQELAENALLLSGRCYEHELAPFKAVDPIVDALSEALGRLPAQRQKVLLPPGVGALATLFPVLEAVEAIRMRSARRSDDALDPVVRTEALGALRSLMFAMGRSRRIAVVIDDAQWSDDGSARLLSILLEPPDPPPIMLLLACPSDAQHPLRRAFRADTDGLKVCEISLGPLGDEQARDLAEALLGPELDHRALAALDAWPTLSADERRQQARMIADESAGVPLFVYELAHHSRHERAARPASHAPKLTIDEVVRHRAARLPRPALDLLEILAVADHSLPIRVALRAADLRANDRVNLETLIKNRLAKRRGDHDVEPYHRRVGAAIRAELPADAVRRRHAKIAAALTREADGDPTVLITHLAEAGRSERVAEAARRAAARAAQASSPARGDNEAAGLSRFGGQKARAKALEEAGDPEAAHAYLDAARLTKDPFQRREMRRRAADQMLRFGRIDEGTELLDGILKELGVPRPTDPSNRLGQLTVERAELLRRGLAWRERRPDRPDGERIQRSDACWTAAVGFSIIDPLTAALYSTRYLALTLDLGDPNRIARALSVELAFLTASGTPQPDRVREVLHTLRAVAKRIDAPYVRGFAALGAGLAALHDGRWAETAQCCRNAERVFKEQCASVHWEISTAAVLQLWAAAYQGRFAGLRPALETRIGHAVARRNRYSATLLRLAPQSNVVWLADGDVAAARRHLDEATRTLGTGFRLPNFWALAARVQIDLYTGRGVDAFRRLALGWPALVRSELMTIQLVRVEALGLRARSVLAAIRQDGSQRPLLAQARTDAQRLIDEGTRWAEALGRLLTARIHAAIGLTAEAIGELEQAENLFEQAAMVAHAASAAAHRRQIAARAHGGATDDRVETAPPLERLTALGIRDPSAWLSLVAP